MRKIGLEELKRIQLEILNDVHTFCVGHGIRYSLAYGTLLGAVRHQGYIPWDDDIDIMMPRPDYERFLQEYESKDNEAVDCRKLDTCIETFTKVCRKHSAMTDVAWGRTLWGINIDVFPMDGCPEDAEAFYVAVRKKYRELARLCPLYKVVKRNKLLWWLKYAVKRVVFFYPHSFMHKKIELVTLERHCNFKETGLAWHSGCQRAVEASVLSNYIDIQFEGMQYKSVLDYDAYLKVAFGDYMKLPPIEQRVLPHQYDAYILD